MLLPEPDLPNGAALVAEGRALARDWSLGPSAFLKHYGVTSEHAFKLDQMAAGRVMLHAQIGYRDPGKSQRNQQGHVLLFQCSVRWDGVQAGDV